MNEAAAPTAAPPLPRARGRPDPPAPALPLRAARRRPGRRGAGRRDGGNRPRALDPRAAPKALPLPAGDDRPPGPLPLLPRGEGGGGGSLPARLGRADQALARRARRGPGLAGGPGGAHPDARRGALPHRARRGRPLPHLRPGERRGARLDPGAEPAPLHADPPRGPGAVAVHALAGRCGAVRRAHGRSTPAPSRWAIGWESPAPASRMAELRGRAARAAARHGHRPRPGVALAPTRWWPSRTAWRWAPRRPAAGPAPSWRRWRRCTPSFRPAPERGKLGVPNLFVGLEPLGGGEPPGRGPPARGARGPRARRGHPGARRGIATSCPTSPRSCSAAPSRRRPRRPPTWWSGRT